MLSTTMLKATLRVMETRLKPATEQRDKYIAEVAELESGIADIKAELAGREAAQKAA